MKNILRLLLLPALLFASTAFGQATVDLAVAGLTVKSDNNTATFPGTGHTGTVSLNAGNLLGTAPVGSVRVQVSGNQFINIVSAASFAGFSIESQSATVITFVNTVALTTGNFPLPISINVKAVQQTASTSIIANISIVNPLTIQENAGTQGNNSESASSSVGDSPLPVTIAAFSAKAAGANAQLDWVTSAERNNAFFDILHSTDLKNFESLGKVNGKGTTSARNTYSFTHFNPDPAVIHYYKLRQVDFDGTYADQPVRSVQFDSYVGIGLKAHADAARNVRVFVDYGDEHLAADATVSILDVNGQKVGARNVLLTKGRNTIDFASASLASGVYLVRLENDSKNASVRIMLP